eukprot:529065_1
MTKKEPIQEMEQLKRTTQHKYSKDELNVHYADQPQFDAPKVDDYINCDKGITHCASVNRIIGLLAHHKNIQSKPKEVDSATMTMFEYIKSLSDNYKLSDVIEDWHHFKTKHTLNKPDIKYLEQCTQINCNDTVRCMYLNRHQRDRSRETYRLNQETDHKNIILSDQMDSIHAYIFHAIPSRFSVAFQNEYIISNADDSDYQDENKYDQKQIENPESVSDCTVSQIIAIVKEIVPGINELQTRLLDIIEYIKQNKFDGTKITEMPRKYFMKQIASHFDDKKLTFPFGRLYNAITKYDITGQRNNNSTLEPQQTVIMKSKNNNKFVSANISNSNYAFGTQYRYTENLAHHKLYVDPKYVSLKEEIIQYFTRVNRQSDKEILLSTQLANIEKMDQSLQSLSLELIETQINQKSKVIVSGYL